MLEEAIDAARGAARRGAQRSVHLVCLPMDDAEENAVIVNALQRAADVVVQKSIAEGFGLTVAEAMWKARPVVATAVGGIQDQIVDGESGVLLADAARPRRLRRRGARRCSRTRSARERMGEAARTRVRDGFLGARSLLDYLSLISRRLARLSALANEGLPAGTSSTAQSTTPAARWPSGPHTSQRGEAGPRRRPAGATVSSYAAHGRARHHHRHRAARVARARRRPRCPPPRSRSASPSPPARSAATCASPASARARSRRP